MSRLRATILAVALASPGCTRDNPAFELDTSDGSEDPGDGTVMLETTSEGATSRATETRGTDATEGEATTATTTVGETTVGETDTGPAAVCGDGTHDPATEQCDDGNATPEDGCSPGCELEHPDLCGNASLDPGEQCDDFNTSAEDGCGSTCQLEHPDLCGNGVTDPGEECDEGNTTPGDGCGATCQYE